ncbi:unnamed protein product [Bursaphelenchus xylophilus]|uniref:Adenosine 3'-phospho 5'-phosphosulfate transporter 1 n=1 Tax=Bursaphelenchus xylophilus TaxID=6326 RepID=A0A1I7RSF3_BURXY|nr:unnamed protein product [Bursaphelenchus xylophilus]CAG9122995.1 unnamed protein product [Bursaphelenchus xylophilus]
MIAAPKNASNEVSSTALLGTAWNMEVLSQIHFYDFWLFRLLLIVLGYASVMVPGYFLVKFVERKWKNESHFFKNSFALNLLRKFSVGQPEYRLIDNGGGKRDDNGRKVDGNERREFARRCGVLLVDSIGIQLTLISMGFYQERIMTRSYSRYYELESEGDKFGDAQYLVFANRIVALVLVVCYLTINWEKQPIHVPPFYSHSFISISNTLSSWCQYEALKYVSFPAQTICKASKVIPTMLMGRVLRGENYSAFDYSMALLLAGGAGTFLLSSIDYNDLEEQDGMYIMGVVSGIVLMVGYLTFDSFTLNWQKKLFDTKPKVSPHQMMLGVNAFSAILCLVSLLEQGSLFSSTKFVLQHADIARDIFLLSLSGACGQLFIYVTIQKFGPVVFAVIMTVRQILSIVLSSIYFSHHLNFVGILGLLVAFGSILVSIYVRYRKQKRKSVNSA